jgi:hypothetical protein
LTKDGYKAVTIGFDKWLTKHNNPDSSVSADNFSFIIGDGNSVNQSSDLEFKPKYTKAKPDTTNKIATIIGIILTIIGLIIV